MSDFPARSSTLNRRPCSSSPWDGSSCWSVSPSRSWAAAITPATAREVCEALAGGAAAAGLAVVSGMARGLDAVAHHAALTAGGASIGVLGCGLGVVYPESNRRLYNLDVARRTAAHRGATR